MGLHNGGNAGDVERMSVPHGRLIHPDRLRDVWPKVRAGLDTMRADDWIAEDVYHEIRSGRAALHMYGDGFIVLQQNLTEFTRLPELHVWLAYNADGQDVYDEAIGLIRATAERMKAHRITFGSPRKGWAKRYPLVSATYEIPK